MFPMYLLPCLWENWKILGSSLETGALSSLFVSLLLLFFVKEAKEKVKVKKQTSDLMHVQQLQLPNPRGYFLRKVVACSLGVAGFSSTRTSPAKLFRVKLVMVGVE